MSTRATRSRTAAENGEETQTSVKDFFKTTRKPARTRGEKKLIDETEPQTTIRSRQKSAKTLVKNEETKTEILPAETAPIFKKPTRTRARTPSRNAELATADVTGTPPKKSHLADEERIEPAKEMEPPVVVNLKLQLKQTPSDDVVLGPEKPSALDELMSNSTKKPEKKKIRSVAALQARLAEKGQARAIHEQNLKNKSKKVEEHAEILKSPLKKVVVGHQLASPIKKTPSKAVRCLAPPKSTNSVPEYVLPSKAILQKSAEKIRDEADEAHEAEVNRRTTEFLKTSRLKDEVKEVINSGIVLPKSYERIAKDYQHVDTICSIICPKRQLTVAELSKNVRNTSQRDFSEHHLSQILHTYPQSLCVEMKQSVAHGREQIGKYELVVMPNLVDDLAGFVKDEPETTASKQEIPLARPRNLMASPMKSPRKGIAQPALRMPEVDGKTRLDAARMRDRAYIFRYHLIKLVHMHHGRFLESQDIPSTSKIVRMHPLFSVEKHCPPLERAPLPEAPIKKNANHIGMREYMEMNLEPKVVQLPSFVEKAFNDLKSPVKTMTGTSGDVPLSPKKFAEMQADQKKKGGMSLLERIRAKEACRKAAEACIDDDLKIRKSRLSLLDTRYLRTICSIYTIEKSQSMSLDVLADKLVFSTGIPTSRPDVIAHIELLCKVAPSYMAEATVMGKRYLRITDNKYDEIAELVREELQKARNATDEQAKAMEAAHKAAMMKTAKTSSLAPRPFSPKASNAARALKFA